MRDTTRTALGASSVSRVGTGSFRRNGCCLSACAPASANSPPARARVRCRMRAHVCGESRGARGRASERRRKRAFRASIAGKREMRVMRDGQAASGRAHDAQGREDREPAELRRDRSGELVDEKLTAHPRAQTARAGQTARRRARVRCGMRAHVCARAGGARKSERASEEVSILGGDRRQTGDASGCECATRRVQRLELRQ